MPTYEYRCPSCGNNFEKFQKMSDEPVAECPECGTAAVRRLSAGAGLVFKGSGFYITDYRGDSYKKAADADKGGSSSPDKGGSSSPDKGSSSSPDKGGSSSSDKSSSSSDKGSSAGKSAGSGGSSGGGSSSSE